MAIFLVCSLFLLLVLGVPVAFALGLSTLPLFLFADYMPMTVAMQRMYGATQSFPLLAVPFFILAGIVMVEGDKPIWRKVVEVSAKGTEVAIPVDLAGTATICMSPPWWSGPEIAAKRSRPNAPLASSICPWNARTGSSP